MTLLSLVEDIDHEQDWVDAWLATVVGDMATLVEFENYCDLRDLRAGISSVPL